MNSPQLRRRLAVAGLATVAAAMPLAQTAQAKHEAPQVPTRIQVPAGNKVFLKRHAVGVQIYTCTATAGGYAWGPSTPRANLYNAKGKLRGTHFGGPTWQDRDGSKAVGTRIDGVTVDSSAIPWLLLSAKGTPGPDGGDRLANTTYIQRVATAGGLAPAAADCNAATAGSQVEVPYTADYYFWRAKH